MLDTIKINNKKVRPIKLPGNDGMIAKGHELFENPYVNVFICAKKIQWKNLFDREDSSRMC